MRRRFLVLAVFALIVAAVLRVGIVNKPTCKHHGGSRIEHSAMAAIDVERLSTEQRRLIKLVSEGKAVGMRASDILPGEMSGMWNGVAEWRYLDLPFERPDSDTFKQPAVWFAVNIECNHIEECGIEWWPPFG